MADDNGAILAELKSQGSALTQIVRSLESQGDVLNQVAQSLSIVMERQKTGVNVNPFGTMQENNGYKTAIALMIALMGGFMAPLYIMVSTTREDVSEIAAGMVTYNEREISDAAGDASVESTITRMARVMETGTQWMFRHEAEVSRINAVQFERLRALERHTFGDPGPEGPP